MQNCKSIVTNFLQIHCYKFFFSLAGILSYNFLINPFSSDMHISPTIQVIATKSIHINTGADEFVA